MNQPCEDCFDNFIGTGEKGCCEDWEASKSGLYLFNLDGLGLKKVNDITTETYKGAVDMIKKKFKFAAQSIVEEALQRASGVRLKKALRKVEIGRETKTYVPPADILRGAFFERLYSPLSVMKIDEIKFHFANGIPDDAEVLIIEGRDINNPIRFKSFPLVPDIDAQPISSPICFRPDYTTTDCFVWVVLKHASVEPEKTWIDKHCGVFGCDGCMGFFIDGGFFGAGYGNTTNRWNNGTLLYAYGWDGNGFSPNTFGFEIKTTIECSQDKLFCEILPYLKRAILYRGGVHILKEFIASDRMNYITMFGEDWAKAQLPEWLLTSQVETDNSMNQIIGMLTDYDSHCLPCRGPYGVVDL